MFTLESIAIYLKIFDFLTFVILDFQCLQAFLNIIRMFYFNLGEFFFVIYLNIYDFFL